MSCLNCSSRSFLVREPTNKKTLSRTNFRQLHMRPGWIVRSCGESLMASLGKVGKVSRLGHVSSSFSSEKWGTRLHNLTAPREVTEFLGERPRNIMSVLHAACESNLEPSYTLLGLLSNGLGVQQNCNRHATVKSHRLLITPASESGLIRSRMPEPYLAHGYKNAVGVLPGPFFSGPLPRQECKVSPAV